LTEIRANYSRFTLDDSTAILNQAMGLNLSENEVAILESHTEDGIAGLQITAFSMCAHADNRYSKQED